MKCKQFLKKIRIISFLDAKLGSLYIHNLNTYSSLCGVLVSLLIIIIILVYLVLNCQIIGDIKGFTENIVL